MRYSTGGVGSIGRKGPPPSTQQKRIPPGIHKLESEVRKQIRRLVDSPSRMKIVIQGEEINIALRGAAQRINQMLRDAGSDKRVFLGLAPKSITHVQKLVAFGRFRKETFWEGKAIIIFSRGDLIESSGIRKMLASTDFVSTTAVFEGSIWHDILNYLKYLRNPPSQWVARITNELFAKGYGINPAVPLPDHLREEMILDLEEFVAAHEGGHFESVTRLGSAFKGFEAPFLIPSGTIIMGGTPARYFSILNELLADISALERLLSVAQENPARGKKLFLLFLLHSSTTGEASDNLELAISRSIGLSAVQNAMLVDPDGNIQFDYDKMRRSVAQLRITAESHLVPSTARYREIITRRVGASRILETTDSCRRDGVPDDLLDYFTLQEAYLFLQRTDSSFAQGNMQVQDALVGEFEGMVMQDPMIVGGLAGRFRFPLELRRHIVSS